MKRIEKRKEKKAKLEGRPRRRPKGIKSNETKTIVDLGFAGRAPGLFPAA